jgi:hypothetical protein
MPRSRVSQADQRLIAYAAGRGRTVTARQLERWRERALLARNVRRGLGRGSTSTPAPGSDELVVWLADHARPGRRPSDLALLAFGAGLAVPEATVRAAFVAAVNRIELSAQRDLPAGSAPEDVADAALDAGLRVAMVPGRVRRIDKALAGLGLGWDAPELAALDPGSGVPRMGRGDWTLNAIQALLAGGDQVDLGTLGGLARSMGPEGAAPP